MKNMPVAKGEDPSVVNRPPRICSASRTSSAFRGIATLVPKRAILQIPKSYAERIETRSPARKIVSWADFYAANRGWITTVEISRDASRGQ